MVLAAKLQQGPLLKRVDCGLHSSSDQAREPHAEQVPRGQPPHQALQRAQHRRLLLQRGVGVHPEAKPPGASSTPTPSGGRKEGVLPQRRVDAHRALR